MNEEPLLNEILQELRDASCLVDVSDPSLRNVMRSAVGIRPEPRPSFANSIHARMADFDRARALATSVGDLASWRAVAVVLAIIIGGILTAAPPARALAGELVQEVVRFFVRSDAEVIPPDRLGEPDQGFTEVSVAEAEVQTNFDLRLPETLPAGYELQSVAVSPAGENVRIRYSGPSAADGVMAPVLFLSQQSMPFETRIGPSAEVVDVTVDGIHAEYVRGGWEYVQASEVDGDQNGYQWQGTRIPQQTLRWEMGGVFYDLTFIGSDTAAGYMDKGDLIGVAESMQP